MAKITNKTRWWLVVRDDGLLWSGHDKPEKAHRALERVPVDGYEVVEVQRVSKKASKVPR